MIQFQMIIQVYVNSFTCYYMTCLKDFEWTMWLKIQIDLLYWLPLHEN